MIDNIAEPFRNHYIDYCGDDSFIFDNSIGHLENFVEYLLETVEWVESSVVIAKAMVSSERR